MNGAGREQKGMELKENKKEDGAEREQKGSGTGREKKGVELEENKKGSGAARAKGSSAG